MGRRQPPPGGVGGCGGGQGGGRRGGRRVEFSAAHRLTKSWGGGRGREWLGGESWENAGGLGVVDGCPLVCVNPIGAAPKLSPQPPPPLPAARWTGRSWWRRREAVRGGGGKRGGGEKFSGWGQAPPCRGDAVVLDGAPRGATAAAIPARATSAGERGSYDYCHATRGEGALRMSAVAAGPPPTTVRAGRRLWEGKPPDDVCALPATWASGERTLSFGLLPALPLCPSLVPGVGGDVRERCARSQHPSTGAARGRRRCNQVPWGAGHSRSHPRGPPRWPLRFGCCPGSYPRSLHRHTTSPLPSSLVSSLSLADPLPPLGTLLPSRLLPFFHIAEVLRATVSPPSPSTDAAWPRWAPA